MWHSPFTDSQLIFFNGVELAVISILLAFTTYKTWNNLHPILSAFMPDFCLGLCAFMFNESYRKFAFIYGWDDFTTSLYVGILLSGVLYWRLHRMIKKFSQVPIPGVRYREPASKR